MALTFNTPIPALVSSTNSANYTMTSFTPTGNAMLVIMVVASGINALANATITDANNSWERETLVTKNSGNDTLYLFWTRLPASTVSIAPLLNFGGASATGCIMHLLEITGHDHTTITPIRQAATKAATSTNANIDYSIAPLITSGQVAFWAGALGAGSSTEPAGWTEVYDSAYNVPNTNGSTATSAGSALINVSFTNASTNWAGIAVEIYASGVGPVTPKTYLSALGVG